MKAIRTHDYRIDGYGNVNFIKVDIGSGHSTFKVFWRREGAERGTRIAWLKESLNPSAKLALFFLPDGLFRRGWARSVLLL